MPKLQNKKNIGGERVADEKNTNYIEKQEETAKFNIEELETPPSLPKLEIRCLKDEPPLCGKIIGGKKVEETALDKKREREFAEAKVKSMLNNAAPLAVSTIIDIMNDPTNKPDLRLKAATDITDRVIGKAKQVVDNDVKGDIKIRLSTELEEYSE